MHPSKVLGALQQHIDAGHEKSALQAIPDLQLQHPQFHNELEQQKARLSARLAEGVKVLDRDSAEIFRCVNCGAGLALQSPESTHVICHYCGCNAENPVKDIHLERWNTALDLESNFTIGDFFQYNKQRWQAIGVQLFSGRLREYDSEDGWESSYARYTSWWMLNERRELAWLIDDGSKRYWSDKFIPDKPFNPDTSVKQYEHGEWKLEFAAGEFSYQPVKGERHTSSEKVRMTHLPIRPGGSKLGYNVSIETRLDSEQNPKEIEFYRSRRVPDSVMFEGLGKDLELTGINRWKNSIRSLVVVLPLLAGLAFLFNRGGESISQSVDLIATSSDLPLQTFEVSDSGTMIAFNGSVDRLKDNSWMGVNVELQDSNGEGVYSKYLEFWRESGRDSDGRWSEIKRKLSWHVRVDEPGTYTAVASTEPSSSNSAARFTLRSEPNRTSLMPFIFAAVFTAFMIVIFRSKLSSISAVAASIAVKLKRRFDPAGKPARASSTEQVS